jgi:hypothetical protein
MVAADETFEVEYSASKHSLRQEQAREFIAQADNDKAKLGSAAEQAKGRCSRG